MWPIRRTYRHPAMTIGGRPFAWGERTYVMGVINVTPDSFSGDGLAGAPEAAAEQARAFEAAGADLIDVGAESTRPDAPPVDEDEELQRLRPALEAVRAATSLPVSVDTYRASVAEAALDLGVDAINDVTGLRGDPRTAGVAARRGVPVIAMYNHRDVPFRDVIGDIREGIEHTLACAAKGGLGEDSIVVDPGFGFGWTPEQNLEMLRRTPELWPLGLPLLMGTSRKSTIGLVLDLPAGERVEGTAATVALAISAGADIVRVHDVREMVRVARMSDAVVRGHWRSEPG